MIPEQLQQTIVSIKADELAEMYARFQKETGSSDVEDFALKLYAEGHITRDELKRIQNEEQVELTDVATIRIPTPDDDFPETVRLDPPPPQDPYTILQSIDRGAMGEILIARDNELGRTVAYKKIHGHVSTDPRFVNRFFMEAQVTAQLQHPNIVPIYGLMVKEGQIGYAMKLIEGKTLKDLIQEARDQLDKGRRPDELHNLPALLDDFLKVCDAMHYAHRKGVVHRDLKPVNIMVGPYNEVYVMDWGIAKIVKVDKATFEDMTERVVPEQKKTTRHEETGLGELLGTPAYMSPEQGAGRNDTLDHRSDLFSLGLILYEIVTLQRAVSGESPMDMIGKIVRGEFEPPEPYSKKLNVPGQLLAIAAKATQLDPDKRYATVKDFADDIRRYVRGQEIRARKDTLGQKVMRWMQRHRTATLNIIIYLVLGSVVAVGWSLYQNQKTLVEAQMQQRNLSGFLTAVADRTQQIDMQFLRFEAILEGLAAGATNLLNYGAPDPGRYYDYTDFADPDRAPPDYTDSSVYGTKVSTGWHSYKRAPGVTIEDVDTQMRRLNPLRHTFERLILESSAAEIDAGDEKAARALILEKGLPLVWAYVGLESGLYAEYPGKTGYPADYDPRNRPWYTATRERTGASYCWARSSNPCKRLTRAG